VKQGAATLMISLPAKWTKQFSLKKGDEVDIEESEGNLLIGAKKLAKEKTKIELKGDLGMESANLDILALYLKGFDEIEVSVDDSKIIKKIQDEILSVLIGFEIVRQEKNSCVIKEIAVPSENEFENMVQRLWFLAEQMGQESLETLEEGKTNLESVEYMDKNINKFAFFCMRTLNKKSGKRGLYLIINNLELIGDSYRMMAKFITKHKVKPSAEEIDLLKETISFFVLIKKFFYSRDKADAGKFILKYKKLKKDFENAKSSKISSCLSEILDSIADIYPNI